LWKPRSGRLPSRAVARHASPCQLRGRGIGEEGLILVRRLVEPLDGTGVVETRVSTERENQAAMTLFGRFGFGGTASARKGKAWTELLACELSEGMGTPARVSAVRSSRHLSLKREAG